MLPCKLCKTFLQIGVRHDESARLSVLRDMTSAAVGVGLQGVSDALIGIGLATASHTGALRAFLRVAQRLHSMPAETFDADDTRSTNTHDQEIAMNSVIRATLALAAVSVMLAGCNKSEPTAEVQRDVAAATQDAAVDVADARKDAASETLDASKDMRDASSDMKAATAEGRNDVAVAKAEGEHKIAVEKCEALSGDAQKACKTTADAVLETAKAKAQSAMANN